MKFWLLQTGEPLHIDGGFPRPMRVMNLANALIDRGHTVEIWSSAFYHQEKRHRTNIFQSIQVNDQLIVHLIPSLGYKRNIGLGRLLDHAQMAFRLSNLLNSGCFEKPDVVFVGYPPIEVAWVMLRYAKQFGIPSIIDVKDQWPSLFIEAVPEYLQFIAKLVFYPYFLLGRRAMRDATGITSMSTDFLNWSLQFCGRSRQVFDAVVPLVPTRLKVSEIDLSEARSWWTNAGIDFSKVPVFSFVGSLSQAFDFLALRDAVAHLEQLHPNCMVVICGTGAEEANVKSLFAGLSNVLFPGWIDVPKIAVLMESTVSTLAPYRNTPNFQVNIPNKILDSLSYGRPVVTALEGAVQNLILESGIGIACLNTVDGWLNALCCLLEDVEFRLTMSRNAAQLYADKFESETVYGSFVDHLERLSFKSNGR